jgi:ribosomal protein L37AE/L43A
MSYKRPFCPNCKLFWGKEAIGKLYKCSKCGRSLEFKDFNPYKGSLLGLLVIIGGALTLLIKAMPIIWIGGFIWGLSLINNAFASWGKVKELDGGIRHRNNFKIDISNIINRLKHLNWKITNCPSCGRKLRIPNKKVIVRCPKCGNSWTNT